MNFNIGTLYEDVVNLVIRPQRCRYDETRALGPKLFTLANRIFERNDFEVTNDRGMTIQSSLYQPIESQRPAKKMPCVIYCHGNCVAGETPVTLRSGISRRIDSVTRGMGVHAWGREEAVGEGFDIVTDGSVSHVLDQGVRDCIRLELEDGRDIVVTPEHEILVVPLESKIHHSDAVWREAQDLQHGDHIICSTLEGVSDDLCAEMEVMSPFALLDWTLQHDRDTVLSFSRLCGAFAAQEESNTFRVKDVIDAEQLIHDIEAVTGHMSTCASYSTHGIEIEISPALSVLFQRAGCHRPNSKTHAFFIPTFLLDPDCPSSVLREFIASWWGIRGRKTSDNSFSALCMAYRTGGCTNDKYGASNQSRKTLQLFVKRLNNQLFRGKSVIKLHTTYSFSESGTDIEQHFQEEEMAKKGAVACGVYGHMELFIERSETIPFAETIGVRYGADILRQLTMAKCYLRYLEQASNDKITNGPKNLQDFMEHVGFDNDNSSLSIALRLVRKESCGSRSVFDITVPKHHSFVAAGCVVHNCGSRCDALDAVQVLLPYNINVLALDFTGSGLSEGDYVSLGFYEKQDVLTVCEHLWSLGTVSRIGLWGRSMGAATSIMFAARDPNISGIVCDSPFTSLEDVMRELVLSYQNWVPKRLIRVGINIMRKSIFSRAHFDIRKNAPIEDARNCFVPVLFAHGEGDDFIKVHHSEKLYEAYAGDKNIIRFEGDHNSERPDFFYESVVTFFYNTLIANTELGESAHPIGSIARKMGVGKETQKGRQISELEEDLIDAAADDDADSESEMEGNGSFPTIGVLPTSSNARQFVLPSTLSSHKIITDENRDQSQEQQALGNVEGEDEEEQLIHVMIKSVKEELQVCSEEQRPELKARLEELTQNLSIASEEQPSTNSNDCTDGDEKKETYGDAILSKDTNGAETVEETNDTPAIDGAAKDEEKD